LGHEIGCLRSEMGAWSTRWAACAAKWVPGARDGLLAQRNGCLGHEMGCLRSEMGAWGTK
ncbi:MAG: hypothetical protein PHU99_04240, partial [Candidatus Cloacimonetes bacterium]|nr:hypothetical protein [Candidatus Cloacimonadota bacterium]